MDSYSDLLATESKKNQAGRDIVFSKRNDWSAFEQRTMDFLNKFVEDAKKHNIDCFCLASHDEGINLIQLSFGLTPTGQKDFREGNNKGRLVVESGCSLSYSQISMGKVAVIFYPFKSELSKPIKSYYLYRLFSGPNDISTDDINCHIALLFSLSHYSSTFGNPTISDYFKYTQIRVCSLMVAIRNADWLEFVMEMSKKIGERVIAGKITSPTT